MFWRFPRPPPISSIPAMKTFPSWPTWICTSRMNGDDVTGALHVAPPSSEWITWMAPPPTLKLFQLTYIRPKCGSRRCCPRSRTHGRPQTVVSAWPGRPRASVGRCPDSDALATATGGQEDRDPLRVRLVVDHDRVAEASAVTRAERPRVQVRERDSVVGRERAARVTAGRCPRIVVGGDDSVALGPGLRLGLSHVRGAALSTRDLVDVRAPVDRRARRVQQPQRRKLRRGAPRARRHTTAHGENPAACTFICLSMRSLWIDAHIPDCALPVVACAAIVPISTTTTRASNAASPSLRERTGCFTDLPYP